jgi:hypothetical protein
MKERTFEIIVTNNISDVFGQGFRLSAQQLSSPSGRIDLLVTNGRKNWIVELKKGQANRRAIDQVLKYVDHYRSVGELVEGWIVAHEISATIERQANDLGIRTTAVPISRCEELTAKAGLDEAALSGVRIQAGVVRGGGAMRFGKKEISFEEALLDMDTRCAGLFREINGIAGVEIFSGAMQTTIIYKGFKIGGLRRTNPAFYILSGLVTDRKTEDFIASHGFRKKLKQSKNDHHQHTWYESKTSNLNAMRTLCLDQFERIDRIWTNMTRSDEKPHESLHVAGDKPVEELKRWNAALKDEGG